MKKRPVYGILSIALPIAGIFLGYLTYMLTNNDKTRSRSPLEIADIVVFAGFMFAGLASAIYSLVRRERQKWIPIFGIILFLLIALFEAMQ